MVRSNEGGSPGGVLTLPGGCGNRQDMNTPAIVVVGLTGGIAAGKSTVAQGLRDRGVAVVDADLLARQVVEPGTGALKEIQGVFGAEMIREDGSLNRTALGKRVFGDPAELDRLNAITHPAILALASERLTALGEEGHPWAVWEAALILDNDLRPPLAELVVVICDPGEQVRRVQRRDDLTETEARARVDSQVDNATRRAHANVVLENDGDLESLKLQIQALYEGLTARHGTRAG